MEERCQGCGRPMPLNSQLNVCTDCQEYKVIDDVIYDQWLDDKRHQEDAAFVDAAHDMEYESGYYESD